MLQEFSQAALPALGQLLQRLAVEESASNALALLLRYTIKIFWSCIYMSVPDALVSNPELTTQWLQVQTRILSKYH
jgi:hypothetical protein